MIRSSAQIESEELTVIFDGCIVEFQIAPTESGIIPRQHYLKISGTKLSFHIGIPSRLNASIYDFSQKIMG
ncbi:MAG: hypothetical protein ABUK20_14830, partial [Anaerolineales bacterium]